MEDNSVIGEGKEGRRGYTQGRGGKTVRYRPPKGSSGIQLQERRTARVERSREDEAKVQEHRAQAAADGEEEAEEERIGEIIMTRKGRSVREKGQKAPQQQQASEDNKGKAKPASEWTTVGEGKRSRKKKDRPRNPPTQLNDRYTFIELDWYRKRPPRAPGEIPAAHRAARKQLVMKTELETHSGLYYVGQKQTGLRHRF